MATFLMVLLFYSNTCTCSLCVPVSVFDDTHRHRHTHPQPHTHTRNGCGPISFDPPPAWPYNQHLTHSPSSSCCASPLSNFPPSTPSLPPYISPSSPWHVIQPSIHPALLHRDLSSSALLFSSFSPFLTWWPEPDTQILQKKKNPKQILIFCWWRRC